MLALGALFEAQRRGLRVPGDVATASFDAHEVGAAISPRLTTLRLPRREIGLRAAAMLAEGGGQMVDLGFTLDRGEAD